MVRRRSRWTTATRTNLSYDSVYTGGRRFTRPDGISVSGTPPRSLAERVGLESDGPARPARPVAVEIDRVACPLSPDSLGVELSPEISSFGSGARSVCWLASTPCVASRTCKAFPVCSTTGMPDTPAVMVPAVSGCTTSADVVLWSRGRRNGVTPTMPPPSSSWCIDLSMRRV